MISITQRAKFFQSGCRSNQEQKPALDGRQDIIQTAVIEVDGLRLYSEPPKDAAHAERINKAIERLTEALPPIVP
jgi:hypothetical protein